MHSLQGSSRNDSRTILAQAPCRADLAGGTLDLWPLYLFHPGAVTVNFALTIFTNCRITPTPGKGIRLRSLDTRREDSYANLDELEAQVNGGAIPYRNEKPSASKHQTAFGGVSMWC